MSNNWSRQKPRNNNNYNNRHQRGTTSTQSSKPPLATWKPSVPAWEKDFCFKVGKVPWCKVEEANRFMQLYDKVVKWDASAVEDTFKDAKHRYWAKINGVPCESSLPDPDDYIDDVDWDAEVDIELILDLDREPEPITEEDQHIVNLDVLVSQQYAGYSAYGWGIPEEIKEEIVWGIAEEENVGKPQNSREDQKCDGWNEDSWGRKEKAGSSDHVNNSNYDTEHWDHQNNNNNNSFQTESWGHKNNNNNKRFNHKKGENWKGKDQGDWRKRGEVQRGGNQVEDCRWRNGRGRGRGRGGFQQQSNGGEWTTSF